MIFKWKRAAWTKTKTLKWQKEGIELQLENKRAETCHLVGPELLKIGNFWKVGKRSNSGYSTESSLLCCHGVVCMKQVGSVFPAGCLVVGATFRRRLSPSNSFAAREELFLLIQTCEICFSCTVVSACLISVSLFSSNCIRF